MTPAEIGMVDWWISENGPPFVSRPEAIRRLITKGLEAEKGEP